VLSLPSFEARESTSVDAVMFLDIQITMGTRSGTETKVAVEGIFVDSNKVPLERIRGDGSATIPFPAFNYAFKPAASQAVEHFVSALDASSADLASKLAPTGEVEQTAANSLSAARKPVAANMPRIGGGRRIALVIGNSDYKYVPRLGNPRNDAQLMAETLRSEGFSLVGNKAQIDLDKTAFDHAVQNFGNRLPGATIALFYFAGHGVQVKGANYLVPISANPTKESDVDFQMVDAEAVLHQMQDGGAKLNIMILDACRNNPFGGRGLRSGAGGLAQMQAPEGTLISYATQPGNVASDGDGRDSPYTEALARAVREPGLDIFHVFNEVGLLVKEKTGGAQQPWISSSPIEGDFYFVEK
jgi:hypothetical protein